MAEQMHVLAGSHRDAPQGMAAMGRVPGDQPITVSVYLKLLAPPRRSPPRSTIVPAWQPSARRSMARMPPRVTEFATAVGLTVEGSNAGRRLIRLSGTAAAMEQAFGTELHQVQHGDATYRIRQGVLQVPETFAGRIVAVLGLDTRPAATPKIVPHRGPTSPAGLSEESTAVPWVREWSGRAAGRVGGLALSRQ